MVTVNVRRCVLIKLIQTDDVVCSTLARTWHSAVVLCGSRREIITRCFCCGDHQCFLPQVQTSSGRHGAHHLVDLRSVVRQQTNEDFDG